MEGGFTAKMVGIWNFRRWRGKPMPKHKDPATDARRHFFAQRLLLFIHDKNQIGSERQLTGPLSSAVAGDIKMVLPQDPLGLRIRRLTLKSVEAGRFHPYFRPQRRF